MPLRFVFSSSNPIDTAGLDINITPTDDWSPVVSQTNGLVSESIPFVLEANTDDAMADILREYNRVIDDARYYTQEPSAGVQNEVYFEWSMLDESANPLQRYIHSFDLAFDKGMWFTCGDGNYARTVRGVITAAVNGWWDAYQDRESLGATVIGPLCEDIALTLGGDAPGRINYLRLSGSPTATITNQITKVWIGFRSDYKHGDVTLFEPLWELENGAPLTDAAAAMHAGGSPSDLANNCIEVDFSTTATIAARVFIDMRDVIGPDLEFYNYGRFVVLLRYGTDAATSCTVRVDHTLRRNDRTLLTGDNITAATAAGIWKTVDTGLIVQFPPGNPKAISTVPPYYGFTIFAQLDSGTGSLYLDSIILVPIDEYFIYHENDQTGGAGLFTSATLIQISVSPDDTEGAMQSIIGGTGVYDVRPPVIEGPGIPYNDPTMYITAVTVDDINALAGAITVTGQFTPRYKNMHGAG